MNPKYRQDVCGLWRSDDGADLLKLFYLLFGFIVEVYCAFARLLLLLRESGSEVGVKMRGVRRRRRDADGDEGCKR